MKNCMAALTHDDEAGLDCVSLVDDLFRRMAQDDIRLQLDVFLRGSFAQRDETFLKALTTVFKNCIELGALGGFRRTDDRDNEQLGFHIPRH